jgi:diacylglycerol O-acyltransferase 1
MMASTANFLKLISFHHVMADNRNLMRRIKQQPEQVKNAALFNIQEETYRLAVQYPKNLRALHFARYMLAPTFCY